MVKPIYYFLYIQASFRYLLVLYILFGRIYSGFIISLYRVSEIVYSQTLAIIFTNGILYIVTRLLTRHLPSLLPLTLSIAVEIVLSALWASAAHIIYYKRQDPIRTIIIWDMRKGLMDLINSYGLDIRFNVVSTPNVWDVFKDPDRYLDEAEAVFLIGIHSHERNQIHQPDHSVIHVEFSLHRHDDRHDNGKHQYQELTVYGMQNSTKILKIDLNATALLLSNDTGGLIRSGKIEKKLPHQIEKGQN